MRGTFSFVLVLAAALTVVALVALNHARQSATLRQQNEVLASRLSDVSNRLASLERQLQAIERQVDASAATPTDEFVSRRLATRVLTLDKSGRPWTSSSAPAPVTSGLPVNSTAKRSWSADQVIGPPDTFEDADIPTAWASRQPDGGLEWLSVVFGRRVPLAEVRIRETYNPGAISKVAALVDGKEMILWEGLSQHERGPREFVVAVTNNLSTDRLVIYLDTSRVPGWNEIDAVELVGRDDSRQWAASVKASSSFGELTPSPSSTLFEQ